MGGTSRVAGTAAVVITSVVALVLALSSGQANAQFSCPAADDVELAACITASNGQEFAQIGLTANITLNAPLPTFINTATFGSFLQGNGYTIDANGQAPQAIVVSGGSLVITAIGLTGDTIDGLLVSNNGFVSVSESTTFDNPQDGEAGDCISAQRSVTNESELAFAIGCYNLQRPSGNHRISIDNDIELSQDLPPLTASSKLTVLGNDQWLFPKDGVFGLDIFRIDAGTLAVSDLVIEGNETGFYRAFDVRGGAVELTDSSLDYVGGGVFLFGGKVHVTNSIFDRVAVAFNVIDGGQLVIAGSQIDEAERGVYVLDGNAIIYNTTIDTGADIGVMADSADAYVHISASTLVGNTYGLVTENGGALFARSTVVANSTTADCVGAGIINDSLNLDTDGSCPNFTDLTGTLGPLEDNGCTVETAYGCVRTHAPQLGSNAIGGGVCSLIPTGFNGSGALLLFTITTDQRGFGRPIGAACDAGSVEVQNLPTCAGKLVTIDMNLNGGNGTGTAGDDVILGTPGVDVIDGKAGSDTICGEGGDDTIDGGVGDFRDFLYGGPGDDTMFGGFGIDYIYGEAGEDTLGGQGGSDRLYGGPGNDLIKGDSGADRMFGGSGDDEMFGMGGQDQMWGEAGNDVMQGNFQSDNMFGGPGNDTMFGAGGKDTLFGEGGNDTLAGGDNTDYLNGGANVDSANGGRGRDKPLTEPKVSPGNGRFRDGAGCIAETIVNCQPTP